MDDMHENFLKIGHTIPEICPWTDSTVAMLCDPYRGHSNYFKSFKNKIS